MKCPGMGDRLRATLQRRGMTQGELAKRMTLSKGSLVSYWITNEAISPGSLNQAAEILCIDPAWLAGSDVPIPDHEARLERRTAATQVSNALLTDIRCRVARVLNTPDMSAMHKTLLTSVYDDLNFLTRKTGIAAKHVSASEQE